MSPERPTRPERLPESEIETRLAALPDWERDGGRIRRRFRLRDFRAALAFANRVGMLAEERDHHPDIRIYSWNRVEFELSTHSAGGLTALDFEFAAALDRLARKDEV